jgi:hypothetical protein
MNACMGNKPPAASFGKAPCLVVRDAATDGPAGL